MTHRAHLLVALIAAASVVFILRMVRRRVLRAKYSLLWIGVGVVLVFTATAPGLLDRMSRALGIDYPPAVYFLIAIVFLLVVLIHVAWELSRLEERTRTLAEELALLRATKPDEPLEQETVAT